MSPSYKLLFIEAIVSSFFLCAWFVLAPAALGPHFLNKSTYAGKTEQVMHLGESCGAAIGSTITSIEFNTARLHCV